MRRHQDEDDEDDYENDHEEDRPKPFDLWGVLSLVCLALAGLLLLAARRRNDHFPILALTLLAFVLAAVGLGSQRQHFISWIAFFFAIVAVAFALWATMAALVFRQAAGPSRGVAERPLPARNVTEGLWPFWDR
jgi:hypothetical protein